MPFGQPGVAPPKSNLPKKGKSKSRRYHILWCYREEDSNDTDILYEEDVKSTNVMSAITALLKVLNADVGPDEKLRKSDINIIECQIN